jgi:hypothetical protein
MMTHTSINIEQVLRLIQDELLKSYLIKYVPRDAIIISKTEDYSLVPAFKNFLIRISPTPSGFYVRQPQIGSFFKNNFSVTIELYVKISTNSNNSLTEISSTMNKGILEFHADVISILEHNTLDNNLDPYPGSNIGETIIVKDSQGLTEGVQFDWVGVQSSRY